MSGMFSVSSWQVNVLVLDLRAGKEYTLHRQSMVSKKNQNKNYLVLIKNWKW
jgi:hypothetical protein